VPAAAQQALSSQQAALDSAQYAILGTPTTAGSKNGARATGMPGMGAAAVVGVVGVMVAL